jgi:hypothetical protein
MQTASRASSGRRTRDANASAAALAAYDGAQRGIVSARARLAAVLHTRRRVTGALRQGVR